jgi:hypothetical protein
MTRLGGRDGLRYVFLPKHIHLYTTDRLERLPEVASLWYNRTVESLVP